MPRRLLLALLALLLVVSGTVAVLSTREDEDAGEQVACVNGEAGEAEAEREAAQESAAPRSAAGDLYAGPPEVEPPCGDVPGHPESFAELARANGQLAARQVAPGTQIKPGAYRSAIRERAALPTIGTAWKRFGNPPVTTYNTDFDQTSGSTRQGLGDISGRATAVVRGGDGTLYAGISNGGVWKSTDGGDSWSAIGDALPTQVIGSIAVAGDKLVVLTGDSAFGGSSTAGVGAYVSADGGKTFTHAQGIPDGLLAFKVAVDPGDPKRVYAATGGGLFRSTDGGATYANVALPTGAGAPAPTPDCSGKPNSVKDCFLANMVTDVVVQSPDNEATPDDTGKPGAVMAAVGWRAGTKTNSAGAQQSPGNGIYVSPDGSPGSFANQDFAGNSTPTTDPLTQARLGRIELGAATGDKQDHRIVYAIVQDAVEFNGGVLGLDADQGTTSAAQSDVFNGVWVSTDFGQSWRQLEGSTAIDNDAASGSALSPPVCKAPAVISYCPGIQAWYNEFIAPDPTRQTASGVPTRLAFGLEEVWSNPGADTALDGSTPVRFSVVGRYFAGETCTLLNATNGLPVCPAAQGGTVPKFTTHPDQHGALWVPDGSGGVTLYVADDGGVYKQHLGASDELSNDGWGQGKPEGHSGANAGLSTLQPYDAAMAKDGTVYMGLQDNGEVKIQPDGTMLTVYGGDGFFSAVDPDDSAVAYEEYVAGAMSVTKDGGKTWTDIAPTLTSALFSTPFEMDPNDANHLVIGGRNVAETTAGPGTTSSSWANVYDLGTRLHPGDAAATAGGDDPDNQLSAVDTLSFAAGAGAPTGTKTKDFQYSGGGTTAPGAGDQTGLGVFLPGSYDDHAFTIKPEEGDASVDVKVTWADATNDWDLYLLRDGEVVGSSANGSTTEEDVRLPNPPAGEYTIRVVNFAATGTFDAAVTFAQRMDATTTSTATYVGYCGYCDTVTQGTPFGNGIATNAGGDKPAKAGTSDGWHIAEAKGLPERYVTSVRMDPSNPSTVYATLGGYGRKWAFPGALGEDTSQVGTGHVFKSTDAGATFADVSGDLPDVPANWSVLHNGHLVVGTDVGVFESCDSAGGGYSRLGTGLPTTPVATMSFKPGSADKLVVATFGRGVYTYDFGADAARCAASPGAPTAPTAPTACAATRGFKTVKVTPRKRGLRFAVKPSVDARYVAEVYRRSNGRKPLKGRLIKRFTGKRGSFNWKGSKQLPAGYYSTRVRIRSGAVRDVRRSALLRKGGRFRKRPGFVTNELCSFLRSAELSGPAFAGKPRTPLAAIVRFRSQGSARVVFRQGARRLRKRTIQVGAGKTARVKLPAKAAKAGEVTATVMARSGGERRKVKLASRRLR